MSKVFNSLPKKIKFPVTKHYKDKPLGLVNLVSIFGSDNILQRTKDIMEGGTSDNAIKGPEELQHYKRIFQLFVENLRSKKTLPFNGFIKILLKSFRLCSLDNLDGPLNHDPGKLFNTVIISQLKIQLEKEISIEEINKITSEFVSNEIEHFDKHGEYMKMVEKFLKYQSFYQKSEADISEYYMGSFLEPLLTYLKKSRNNLSLKLREQCPVKVDWAFNEKIITSSESQRLIKAVIPDFLIGMEAQGDLVSYLPIEMKSNIGVNPSAINDQSLKQSVIQSILTGSGHGMLSDARSTLFFFISGFQRKDKEIEVMLDYKMVQNSQLNPTESMMFIYMIDKMNKSHQETLKYGYSSVGKLCGKILKAIKKTKKEQQDAMNSLYKEYKEYLKENHEGKNLFTLIVPKEVDIKSQIEWGDELQRFRLSRQDLAKAKLFKGNKVFSTDVLFRNSDYISITVNDEVINGAYELKDSEYYQEFDLSETSDIISIIKKSENLGINNSYLEYGMIEIVSDGEIISCGEGFITMDSLRKLKLENIGHLINDQVSRLNQVGIRLGYPPDDDKIMEKDGKIYLKIGAMDPFINS